MNANESEIKMNYHVVTITTNQGKQDAHCSCGWDSLGHPYDYTVYDASDMHRRETTP